MNGQISVLIKLYVQEQTDFTHSLCPLRRYFPQSRLRETKKDISKPRWTRKKLGKEAGEGEVGVREQVYSTGN